MSSLSERVPGEEQYVGTCMGVPSELGQKGAILLQGGRMPQGSPSIPMHQELEHAYVRGTWLE